MKFLKCSEPKSLEVCGHSSQRPGSKPLFIDLGANVLALVSSDVDGSCESVSGRTMKKREAGYHKCSQEQGLKTKCVFPVISFLQIRIFFARILFSEPERQGNPNKDSISPWAGRQLLEVFTALSQCGSQ